MAAAASVTAGLTAAVVFWPDSAGSSPSSEQSPRPGSVLESPSAFDEAVDDAVRQIDDGDSVLLDGDAFDRAIAEASAK